MDNTNQWYSCSIQVDGSICLCVPNDKRQVPVCAGVPPDERKSFPMLWTTKAEVGDYDIMANVHVWLDSPTTIHEPFHTQKLHFPHYIDQAHTHTHTDTHCQNLTCFCPLH